MALSTNNSEPGGHGLASPGALHSGSNASLPIGHGDIFHRQDSASSQSSSLTSPQLTPLAESSDDRLSNLGDYFQVTDPPRKSYTDKEIREISTHLENSGYRQWGEAPRLYIVLRHIGHLQALDSILDQGISDLWFPFTASALPMTLAASMQTRFLDSQALVLTKAVDLEKDLAKKHAHFGREDFFPFDVREKLGRGGYAVVDRIFSPFSRRDLARKRFRRGRSQASKSEIQSFKNELQVLKRIQHRHCIELVKMSFLLYRNRLIITQVASYTDTKYFGLIMSPVADCNMAEYYVLVLKDPAQLDNLRRFYGCLAKGLEYLHQEKIRHRDIKPENILIKDNCVHLTDFGISLDWESLSRSTTADDSGKTWIYCAPEVAALQSRNSSSDIWSLGCVFLEMTTVLKLQGIDSMRRYFKQHSDSYRYYQNIDNIQSWSKQLSGQGNEVDNIPLSWTLSMLQADPLSRPLAEDICGSTSTAQRSPKSDISKYTGECCNPESDASSTAESASDSDAWGDDQEKVVTSPPSTDRCLESPASGKQTPFADVSKGLTIPTDHSSPSQGTASVENLPPENVLFKIDGSHDAPTLGGDKPEDSNSDPVGAMRDNIGDTNQFITSSMADPTKKPNNSEQDGEKTDKPNHQETTYLTLERSMDPIGNDAQGTRLEALNDEDIKRIQRAYYQEFATDPIGFRPQGPSLESQRGKEVLQPSTANFDSAFRFEVANTIPSILDQPVIYEERIQPDGHRVGVNAGASPVKVAEPSLPATDGRHKPEDFPWPAVSLRGQLPILTEASWSSPLDLLSAIQEQRDFMKFIRFELPQCYQLVQSAGPGQILPLLLLLTQNGFDVNIPFCDNADSLTPLFKTLLWPPEYQRVFKYLTSTGQYVEYRSRSEVTPFSIACQKSISWALHYMLQSGADVNQVLNLKSDAFGRFSPLTLAAYYGQLESLKIFLKYKANPDSKTSAGYTALMVASMQGSTEIVCYLLENHSKEINIEASVDGISSLLNVCGRGHFAIAQLLLAHKADPNYAHGSYGKALPAWYHAARNGHIQIVELLLEHGADIKEKLFLRICSSELSVSSSTDECDRNFRQETLYQLTAVKRAHRRLLKGQEGSSISRPVSQRDIKISSGASHHGNLTEPEIWGLMELPG